MGDLWIDLDDEQIAEIERRAKENGHTFDEEVNSILKSVLREGALKEKKQMRKKN